MIYSRLSQDHDYGSVGLRCFEIARSDITNFFRQQMEQPMLHADLMEHAVWVRVGTWKVDHRILALEFAANREDVTRYPSATRSLQDWG